MAKKAAPLSTTAVDAALAELEAELAEVEPELEGLRDYSRLNLQPETAAVVSQAIVDYQRRFDLLTTTIADLRALIADGYPDLAVRSIAQAAYSDLQTNAATIHAALAKFEPIPAAASLNPSAGPPEVK